MSEPKNSSQVQNFGPRKSIDKEDFLGCKKQTNSKNCNCTYPSCSRKGMCCDCLKYHLNMRELPSCCFPKDIEATFNRSFEKFAELVNEWKV